MMKKELCYLCCLALLFSCERNAGPDSERGDSVPLSVQELSLSEEAAVSRVSPGVVTTDGSSIGVFLTTQSGYTPEYNRTYTYSAAGGGWTSDAPVWVDKRKAKIVGVYDPNNVGAFPTSNTSPVSSTKLKAQAYSDALLPTLWYIDDTHTDVNYTNASIAFKMKPAYSRIKLSIERHATNYISGNCAITNVNLKSGTTFYADNALDISTGTPQGNATTGGWSYALNTGNIAAGATNTAYDVLVPPQPITAGLTITLTVDGADRAITIPAAKFTSNTLAAGQEYTIELLMTDAEVTFTGVNLTEMGATPTDPNIKFEHQLD